MARPPAAPARARSPTPPRPRSRRARRRRTTKKTPRSQRAQKRSSRKVFLPRRPPGRCRSDPGAEAVRCCAAGAGCGASRPAQATLSQRAQRGGSRKEPTPDVLWPGAAGRPSDTSDKRERPGRCRLRLHELSEDEPAKLPGSETRCASPTASAARAKRVTPAPSAILLKRMLKRSCRILQTHLAGKEKIASGQSATSSIRHPTKAEQVASECGQRWKPETEDDEDALCIHEPDTARMLL
mmetsp:Transcript_3571/g.8426  ORF Transcript_3571/g.8426 Transcript_3571/m.8426 type:complete len:240 (-) Transcript_3571:26-745(-)